MPRVLVPIAPGVEEIETVSIIDILRRAGVEVTVASLSEKTGPIQASRGVLLHADTTLEGQSADTYDMIVIPGGGPGVENLKADGRVLQLLRDAAAQEKITAAICAGPMVLHEAGLLEGKSVTSHPSVTDKLGAVNYSEDRVVIDGKIATSRGPGTAIEFALELVRILCGAEKRDEIAAPLMLR